MRNTLWQSDLLVFTITTVSDFGAKPIGSLNLVKKMARYVVQRLASLEQVLV